jgi:hypothetical protein
MKEDGREEGLLVRAEPLERAEEISQRMVDVVRLNGDALLLDAKYKWAGAIYAVLVERGVNVKEIRKESKAERLIA